jgi:hypothetical protein
MDQEYIIIFIAVLAIVGIRLYQKFAKKGKGISGRDATFSSFSSSAGEDDYEPYSKK